MTGIAERKKQWEQEAIEAERKLIAEWLRGVIDYRKKCGVTDIEDISVVLNVIERGEYKKGK